MSKKRTCHLVDFFDPADHRMKRKENKKDRQIFGSCQRNEKAVEYEGDSDTSCSWWAWNSPLRARKD